MTPTTPHMNARGTDFTAQLTELAPPEEISEDIIRDDFAHGDLQDDRFSGFKTWAQIVAGDDYTVARTTDGRVYVWGESVRSLV